MNPSFRIFVIRLLFAGLSLSLATSVAVGQTHGMKFGSEKRLEVLPVLFLPSDNKSITPQEIKRISNLVFAHLELLQRRYKELLQTDTFKIADGSLNVYYSKNPHSFYLPPAY